MSDQPQLEAQAESGCVGGRNLLDLVVDLPDPIATIRPLYLIGVCVLEDESWTARCGQHKRRHAASDVARGSSRQVPPTQKVL